MLGSTPHIEVVGTARDGDEALEMVARLEPDEKAGKIIKLKDAVLIVEAHFFY